MNKILLFLIAITTSGCSVPFAPVVKVSIGGEVAPDACECKCIYVSEDDALK
jgi:hypothetical protein